MYRKIEAGINPAIEVGRFLTEVAGFANTPALLGRVEFVEGDRRSAVGDRPRLVANQGDGWTVTSAYLDRFVDDQRLSPPSDMPARDEEQMPYLRIMAQAGRRTAELHLALAGNPTTDFAPEPVARRCACAGPRDAQGTRRSGVRCARASATPCARPTGRWSIALVAQRDPARPADHCCRRTSAERTSAFTATSASSRC